MIHLHIKCQKKRIKPIVSIDDSLLLCPGKTRNSLLAWHSPVAPPWPWLLHYSSGVTIIDPFHLFPTFIRTCGAFLHPSNIRIVRADFYALTFMWIKVDFQSVTVLLTFTLCMSISKRDRCTIVMP